MLFERLRRTTDAISRGGDPDTVRDHSGRLFRLLEVGELTVRQWAALMASLLRSESRDRHTDVA